VNVWNGVAKAYSQTTLLTSIWDAYATEFGSNTIQLLVLKCSHQTLVEQFC